MPEPRHMGDAPALRIECGSCHRNVEVPQSLLGQVLQLQQFQCPSCNDWQRLNLDAATMQQLWASQRRASPPASGATSQLHGSSLNGHSHSHHHYSSHGYGYDHGLGMAAGLDGSFERPIPAVRAMRHSWSNNMPTAGRTKHMQMHFLTHWYERMPPNMCDPQLHKLSCLVMTSQPGFYDHWRSCITQAVRMNCMFCALQLQPTWEVKGGVGKASRADQYGGHSAENHSERYKRKLQA